MTQLSCQPMMLQRPPAWQRSVSRLVEGQPGNSFCQLFDRYKKGFALSNQDIPAFPNYERFSYVNAAIFKLFPAHTARA